MPFPKHFAFGRGWNLPLKDIFSSEMNTQVCSGLQSCLSGQVWSVFHKDGKRLHIILIIFKLQRMEMPGLVNDMTLPILWELARQFISLTTYAQKPWSYFGWNAWEKKKKKVQKKKRKVSLVLTTILNSHNIWHTAVNNKILILLWHTSWIIYNAKSITHWQASSKKKIRIAL